MPFERKPSRIARESKKRREERRSYVDNGNKSIARGIQKIYFEDKPLSYIRDALTGKLPTTEDVAIARRADIARYLEESLEKTKKQARISMLEATDPYRAHEEEHAEGLEPSSIGVWLEKAVREGRLPKAIISEDVTGRPIANILSDVILRIQKRITPDDAITVPVISYASGRFTPEAEKKRLAESVAQKLKKYEGQQILICSDAIETGGSMGPLLDAIGGGNFSLALLIDRITRRAEAMIVDKTKNRPAERLSLHPDLEIGQDPTIRSMERWYDPKTKEKSLLLAIEEPEDRVLRLRAEKEIADAMYEAFLERPGIQEYFDGR